MGIVKVVIVVIERSSLKGIQVGNFLFSFCQKKRNARAGGRPRICN
jgi:hypothetical protein